MILCWTLIGRVLTVLILHRVILRTLTRPANLHRWPPHLALSRDLVRLLLLLRCLYLLQHLRRGRGVFVPGRFSLYEQIGYTKTALNQQIRSPAGFRSLVERAEEAARRSSKEILYAVQ